MTCKETRGHTTVRQGTSITTQCERHQLQPHQHAFAQRGDSTSASQHDCCSNCKLVCCTVRQSEKCDPATEHPHNCRSDCKRLSCTVRQSETNGTSPQDLQPHIEFAKTSFTTLAPLRSTRTVYTPQLIPTCSLRRANYANAKVARVGKCE